jgi:hypothetical protein
MLTVFNMFAYSSLTTYKAGVVVDRHRYSADPNPTFMPIQIRIGEVIVLPQVYHTLENHNFFDFYSSASIRCSIFLVSLISLF